jgi:hypothetical protein
MATYAIPTRRSASRADALVMTAVGAAGQLAFGLLVIFHVWLLWTHVVAGKAFEPQTALRWLVAVGVLAGFRALSRRGLPLLVGRRALVLWLLVVLLHCHAVWTGDVITADLAMPEAVQALSQLTGAIALVGAVIVMRLAAHAAAAASRRRADPARATVAGLPSDGFTFRFAPRPPPLA